MSDFELAVSHSLKWEGGLARLSNDAGGLTNFGISLKFLKSINPMATEADIRKITKQEAKKIYFEHFWSPNNYQAIDCQKTATKVFDLAINCGAPMANKFLQLAVNLLDYTPDLVEDGILGSKSITAINKCHPEALYGVLKYNAIAYYAALIVANNNLSSFKNGWLSRCCDDP